MRAKDIQEGVVAKITVEGFPTLDPILEEEEELSPLFKRLMEQEKSKRIDVCKRMARANGTSLDNAIFSRLVNMGFPLLETTVQFTNSEQAGWGLCRWIKDHPKYKEESRHALLNEMTPYQRSLVVSFFDTDNAGEQKYTLRTTCSLGFVLNKAIVVHSAHFGAKPSE